MGKNYNSSRLVNGLSVDSNGNVGIGTNSPTSQLEIYGKTGNQLTDGLRICRNTLQNSQYGVINYSAGILNITGVNTSGGGEIRFNSSDGTVVNERARILSNGLVGFGVSNPSVALEISTTISGANRVLLKPSTDYGFFQINNGAGTTYIGTDASSGGVFGQGAYSMNIYNSYAANINFFTSAILRMQIKANGNKTFTGPGGQDQMFSAYGRCANGDYVDIDTTAGGGNYQGFLIVANSYAYNAGYRTQGTHSILGRSGISVTTIAQVNGGTGSSTYSISTPSDGIIRVTNTGLYGDLQVSWRGFV